MRRSKFVELASAYLDGELTEKDTLLLRKALNENPEYRTLFASYRRMNEAASKARFPMVEIAPVDGYRHGSMVSVLSWGVAGSFAAVMAAFLFVSASRNSQRAEDQMVAMNVERQVVVTTDAKPVSRESVQRKDNPSLMSRTPVRVILADSGFSNTAKDQFKSSYATANAADSLDKLLNNTTSPYSFGHATSVTHPNSSLFTPVSFVSMTDH